MTAPAHPLRAAIQADRHDLAALRLLHGFLVALHRSKQNRLTAIDMGKSCKFAEGF